MEEKVPEEEKEAAPSDSNAIPASRSIARVWENLQLFPFSRLGK